MLQTRKQEVPCLECGGTGRQRRALSLIRGQERYEEKKCPACNGKGKVVQYYTTTDSEGRE